LLDSRVLLLKHGNGDAFRVMSHLGSGVRMKCLVGNTRGYVLILQEDL
jgi:hypothetical protein